MQIGTIVKYIATNAKIYWSPEEDAIGIIMYKGEGDFFQCRVTWNDGRVGWYIPSDLEVICK